MAQLGMLHLGAIALVQLRKARPTPADQVLGVADIDQIRPALGVSVPERAPGRHPSDRPPDQAAHDDRPAVSEPDDGVGAGRDDVSDLRVVAVDDPTLGCRERFDV